LGKVKIVVIGGGYAGLAAAITLADAGIKAVLFEGARHLGGRARSVSIAGQNLDNGQHILLGAYHETLRLIERVAPGSSRALLLRRPLCVYRPGAFRLAAPRLPAPWHLVFGLLAARGLTFAERARALHFALKLRLSRFRAPATQTVSQLLAGQPTRVIAELWEPLCLAALNTPLQLASAQVFLNVLGAAFAKDRADSDFLLPRVDLGKLFAEPARRYLESRDLRIALGQRVRSLRRTSAGWSMATDLEQMQCQAVVLAIGPQHLATLGESCAPLAEIARQNQTTGYQAIQTIYLQLRDSARLAEPMLALDGAPGQWLIDRGQLGANPGLMAMVVSTAPRVPNASSLAMAQAAEAQLLRLFPHLGPVRWAPWSSGVPRFPALQAAERRLWNPRRGSFWLAIIAMRPFPAPLRQPCAAA
jgi:squalene-associated FAD-dependent desaturase